jgi:glutamine synthetase
VPDSGRVEDRTVDGSCNPYLAATAMLSAGMDGIERGLDPGAPNSANLYEMSDAEREAQGIGLLPANLLDATRELSADDALRAGLGRTRDGDYLDYFVQVKRKEVQSAHEQITQWELDRYLQLY